ncbi:MAG: L,D-transpeptidase family protein [Planctomycetes bacterium]|nr:L,D-transpeptidase family protein [Planctomycetota bacterium]
MLDSCSILALVTAFALLSSVDAPLAGPATPGSFEPQGAPAAQRAPAATPARTGREALAPLFARATQDPAGVVPLLVAASTELETLAPKDAALLGDTLEPFARRAFFSGERVPGMEELGLALHRVEKGELPTKIAARYKFGAGLLPYLNDEFDERKLRIGQELKVLDLTQGALELVVEKSSFRLFAWRKLANGKRTLVMCVPVGLGAADSATPTGSTTIVKRVLHPDWTHPVTHKVYKDGDPENVLGGYWVALDPTGIGKNGIGLHGYTGDVAANWIERGASNGCVRMLQNDIDRVFHLALEGTRVELRDTPAR